MLIYPRPEDLRFDNIGGLIESGAIFNNEARDYLKIEIIDSSKNSYSNYVNRSAGGSTITSQFDPGNATALSIKETIYLYIPQTLSESYQQGYNTASIGMLGAGVLNAMGARSDTASMAGEIKQAAMGLKPEAALSAMASGISGVANIAGVGGQLDANGVSQLTRGAILNPYKELIYQGTDFRSHQFSFKMVARDLAQANTINSIISTMRFAMHPGIAGVGGDEEFGTDTKTENTSGTQNGTQSASQAAKVDNSKTSTYNFQGQPTNADRWLLIPDFFKLTFVRFVPGVKDGQGAKKLNRIVQLPVFCVLEGMSINYTPDGQYNPLKRGENTDDDLGVLAVQMDLQFKETAMLTKVNFGGSKQSGSELWKKQTPAPGGGTAPGTKADPNKGNNK
jgi:hypothetical protein